MSDTLLLMGCGYSARRFAERHGTRFARILATARTAEKAAELQALGMDAFIFDGQTVAGDLAAALGDVSHVLSSIPPGNGQGDPALSVLAPSLSRAPLKVLGYLSTTGVYGDRGGAWVDEATPPRPTGPRGKRRFEAENVWRAFAAERGAHVLLFRLPGIYGPGRNALVQLKAGTARRVVKPGQVFSRIHVDDLADTVAAAFAVPQAGEAWNVADDEPAPPQDVVAFAARLMGTEPPPEIPFEQAAMSPMAQSFWAENKRVANAAIKTRLGVRLSFPTYREGLRALYAAGDGS